MNNSKNEYIVVMSCIFQNMQEVMADGADAIDVVARCLALKHISILELVENEQKRRIEKSRQVRRNSARV